MGAVKQQLEMIDLFVQHFCDGELSAAKLEHYVFFVRDMATGKVSQYGLKVVQFDDRWLSVSHNYDTGETTLEDMDDLAPPPWSAWVAESEACHEAIFRLPGLIVEID